MLCIVHIIFQPCKPFHLFANGFRMVCTMQKNYLVCECLLYLILYCIVASLHLFIFIVKFHTQGTPSHYSRSSARPSSPLACMHRSQSYSLCLSCLLATIKFNYSVYSLSTCIYNMKRSKSMNAQARGGGGGGGGGGDTPK
jgi:hypothetical protein